VGLADTAATAAHLLSATGPSLCSDSPAPTVVALRIINLTERTALTSAARETGRAPVSRPTSAPSRRAGRIPTRAARLAPDAARSERSLAELLDDADGLATAAEIGPYVSRLATGLHVLGAPLDAELMATFGPERSGELVAFLSTFYEVVLLDLGTGVAGPLARFAVERADQLVLVTTPEWVTSTIVLEALAHLEHDRTTVVLNKSYLRSGDVSAIEDRFRAEHLHRAITIPHDEQLATMLDNGTYVLDALGRPTRLAIKRLGLAVAEQLV
jgi:MinD-like ATPase involved in chromosome partitioning or flagellar assembly